MGSLREELEATIEKSESEAPAVTAGDESTASETSAENTPAPDSQAATPETSETQDTDSAEARSEETSTAAEAGQASQEEAGQQTEERSPKDVAPEYPAPKSWKPAARQKWTKLDPEIQAEVTRREKQIMHEFGVNNQARQIANEFNKVVQPFQARMQALGVSPMRAVNELLKADHILSSAPPQQKAQHMARLIREYGVDIKALDSALAGEQPDPQTSALEQMLSKRLAPIQQFVNQQRQAAEQQKQARQHEALSTVQAMAADSTKYPFFEDVRQDMADLMELAARRGIQLTPEEAYERAVHINPETAPLVAKQQMSQMQRSTAQKQSAKAQAAKRASASVTGSPSAGPTKKGDNSLRGTLEAAVAQASGR